MSPHDQGLMIACKDVFSSALDLQVKARGGRGGNEVGPFLSEGTVRSMGQGGNLKGMNDKKEQLPLEEKNSVAPPIFPFFFK